MKRRTFFNWLIIFLGVVAIMGFCFTPVLADESADDMEIQDDSFGAYYQNTWVPAADFVPNGNGPYYFHGAYRYRASGSAATTVAPVRLPSGAHLYRAQLFYYDNSSMYYATATLYRYQYNNTSTLLDSCSGSTSATPGYTACIMYPNVTIQNGDSVYQLRVQLTGVTSHLRFMGVRLYWKRQIRTGLSHPFTDIGHLPQLWQDSIAALRASGITSGTTATTYSPDANVTRGQMAVFFARALGLYWSPPTY